LFLTANIRKEEQTIKINIFFKLRDTPGIEIFGRAQKNAPLYFCTPETISDLLIK